MSLSFFIYSMMKLYHDYNQILRGPLFDLVMLADDDQK